LIVAALAKRIPMATRKAARISGNKVLRVIMALLKSLHLQSPPLVTDYRFFANAVWGEGRGWGAASALA
jgi:hypothetical protein